MRNYQMPQLRHLTSNESDFLKAVAAKLEHDARTRLLDDVAAASVNAEGDFLHVTLDGYYRPAYTGHSNLQYEGALRDLKGGLVSLLVNVDQNDRLLELECIWWENDREAGLDWTTLAIVSEPKSGDSSPRGV